MICGVAPLPASSGQTQRHRLNRGGDRAANSALHLAVISRLRADQRTKDYAARRTADGLSKREIIRCLKRYVARELYPLLRGGRTAIGKVPDVPAPHHPALVRDDGEKPRPHRAQFRSDPAAMAPPFRAISWTASSAASRSPSIANARQ